MTEGRLTPHNCLRSPAIAKGRGQRAEGRREKIDGSRFQDWARVKSRLGDCYICGFKSQIHFWDKQKKPPLGVADVTFFCYCLILAIVVEGKLIGMRPQPHRVNFIIELVANPGIDEVFREHARFRQESVVFLQRFQRQI